MKNCVLAFDFGGSGCRASIGEIHDGLLSVEEIFRFENAPVEIDGHLHWDFDKIFESVKACLVLAKKYNYSCIGIDSWGVDYGLLDADGRLMSPPFHYRDPRTDAAEEKVLRRIDGDELYRLSGIQPMRINTMFQLAADGDRLKSASSMLFIPDLVAYLLTGERRSEVSIASTSGLFDQKAQDWNYSLIDRLGFPRAVFAPIIKSGEIYGMLDAELCRKVGVAPVPVVAVCTHDTASAILSAPKMDENAAYLSCGTWALLGVMSDRVITSDSSFTNECGYGGRITYLNNSLGMWLIQEIRRNLKERGEAVSYEELDVLARQSDYDGLINPQDARFELPCDMEAVIADYCRESGQEPPRDTGDAVRCAYMSLAMNYAKKLAGLSKVFGKKYDKINMLGGGGKSHLLCQMSADVTGADVIVGNSEATLMGNIAVQFLSIGAVKSLDEFHAIAEKTQYASTFSKKQIIATELYRKFDRLCAGGKNEL